MRSTTLQKHRQQDLADCWQEITLPKKILQISLADPLQVQLVREEPHQRKQLFHEKCTLSPETEDYRCRRQARYTAAPSSSSYALSQVRPEGERPGRWVSGPPRHLHYITLSSRFPHSAIWPTTATPSCLFLAKFECSACLQAPGNPDLAIDGGLQHVIVGHLSLALANTAPLASGCGVLSVLREPGGRGAWRQKLSAGSPGLGAARR